MNLARTFAVVVGVPLVIDLLGWPTPTAITAVPGSVGTLSVEWSTTATAAANPAAASWSVWPAGSVAVKTSDTLDSPVCALRVTALGDDGSFDLVGA